MMDLVQGESRDGQGMTRRDLLRVGSTAALAGLSLPGLLMAESDTKPRSDVSVILLWMQGGPSHLDLFDPKPEAPTEIRGEFGVISTAVSGVSLSEHLPQLAKNLDKLTLIRSGYTTSAIHGVADAAMLSGVRTTPAVVHPTYGSVIAKELGGRNGLPPFVQLGANVDRRFNGHSAGFLGDAFGPMEIAGDPNAPNFSVAGTQQFDRYRPRPTMLEQLGGWRREVETKAAAFQENARSMVSSTEAKKAFDLSLEHPKRREAYGRTKFGQSCLLARRLVQSGVRFVTVTDGGWDTHANNFATLKNR
ncbi:MAG: DUF1501 domain-containing protein, partial [Planctomycetia bacterium]